MAKYEITDAIYDMIEDEIRRRDPAHPRLQKVGAPVSSREKVKLPFYLPSLDKIKTGDALIKWSDKYPGPYVITDKMDGISLGIKGDKLYTRGDGTSGQDVSHLIKHLKLPKIPATMAVRCEVEMTESQFKKVFPDGKNARNTASGLLNQKKVDTKLIKALDVIAYEIIEPAMKPSAQLKKLKQLGFKTVTHALTKKLTHTNVASYLTERKKTSDYAIDGLVIYQDKKVSRKKSGNPDHARAFKMMTEGDFKDVKVKEVIWQISKYGYLKPVVIVEE
jgi:DNA ligase (NAD+)